MIECKFSADVVELVDTVVLEAATAWYASSSLAIGTQNGTNNYLTINRLRAIIRHTLKKRSDGAEL